MKHPFASMIVVAALAASSAVAHAGDGSDDQGWAGVAFDVLPSGSLSTSGFGLSGKADTELAYGVELIAEKEINELISVGFAPRYVWGIKGTSDSSSNSSGELDLRARVSVGHAFGKLRAFGFAEPGWAILFLPDTFVINNEKVHPNGFVIGFGGGVSFALSRTLSATAELGYQPGFETWSYTATVLGQQVTTNGDAKTSFLTLGFGLTAAID